MLDETKPNVITQTRKRTPVKQDIATGEYNFGNFTYIRSKRKKKLFDKNPAGI